jgi:oxygen-independent coproporphyrinogen-3 oxidase
MEDEVTMLEELFEKTSKDLLCNTSYPIKKEWFEQYRQSRDIMENVHEMSFYFHIPFCQSLCTFCEYTKFVSRGEDEEERYIHQLIKQCTDFMENHNIDHLYGLDVGGGTPTSLNKKSFDRLMYLVQKVKSKYSMGEKVDCSMEFSFSSFDIDKIRMAAQSGFGRVSAGLQVYDKTLLNSNNRGDNSVNSIIKQCEEIYKTGVHKINLDIMYGLKNETFEMLKNTLDALELIQPDQITLYETRYNEMVSRENV